MQPKLWILALASVVAVSACTEGQFGRAATDPVGTGDPNLSEGPADPASPGLDEDDSGEGRP